MPPVPVPISRTLARNPSGFAPYTEAGGSKVANKDGGSDEIRPSALGVRIFIAGPVHLG